MKHKVVFDLVVDNEIDFDALEKKLIDIFKVSSDYQHANLSIHCDPEPTIVFPYIKVSAYPNDFRDFARSREALKEAFKMIVDEVT